MSRHLCPPPGNILLPRLLSMTASLITRTGSITSLPPLYFSIHPSIRPFTNQPTYQPERMRKPHHSLESSCPPPLSRLVYSSPRMSFSSPPHVYLPGSFEPSILLDLAWAWPGLRRIQVFVRREKGGGLIVGCMGGLISGMSPPSLMHHSNHTVQSVLKAGHWKKKRQYIRVLIRLQSLLLLRQAKF